MHRRVIIIDNDPLLAGTAGRVFSGKEDKLLVTTNATAVLDNSPTHVILDPAERGVEALDLIDELSAMPSPPALILVSEGDARLLEATKQTALSKGLRIVSTAIKPITVEQLVSLLENDRDASPDRPTISSTMTNVAANDIETAIRNGKVHYVYQPRIDCHTRKLSGFEALARWRDVPPLAFIRKAEEAGLMRMLTRQLFAEGIRWLSAHFREGQCTLAMNLSSECIVDVGLAEYLCALCRHFDIHPARIVLEVAEPAVANTMVAVEQVTRLRLKGFRVALDDAGAGYSSLEQLLKLPFSDLEIDRTFVRRVGVSEECRGIVDMMIGLAHQLDLVVTGKGVETQESFDYLSEHGCDLAQGFHIARPLEQHVAGAWLN